LLRRTGVDQRRADDVHRDGVQDLGSPVRRHLLGEDDLLLHRRAAAAVCARPLDAHPPRVGEPTLPGALEEPPCLLVLGWWLGRPLRAQPRRQLGAKGLLVGRVGELEHARPPRYPRCSRWIRQTLPPPIMWQSPLRGLPSRTWRLPASPRSWRAV